MKPMDVKKFFPRRWNGKVFPKIAPNQPQNSLGMSVEVSRLYHANTKIVRYVHTRVGIHEAKG